MRRLVVGAGLLAVLSTALFVVGAQFVEVPVPLPDKEDVWRPENAIVLDSAQISGSPRAYLFWYDAGAFGFTVRMVSLGNVGHEQAIIKSDYMTHIRWSAPDTLIVDLYKDQYELLDARQGVVIVPLVHP